MAARFERKAIIVTGAARGIGRAIALAFAREKARVCLIDIEESVLADVADECRGQGGECFVCKADVSRFSEIEASVKRCVAEFSRLDVLVNNAGIISPSSDFEQTSEHVWERVLQVNLWGPINCCRAAIPVMKEQRCGRIVNAASMYGLCPQVGRAPYSVSKAAIVALTRVLAAELGPFGITVNAYAPGTIATGMAEEALRNRGDEKLRQIPLGRLGEVEDVAQLVLFLSSDEAAYITGTTVLIDGGATSVHSPWRSHQSLSEPPDGGVLPNLV